MSKPKSNPVRIGAIPVHDLPGPARAVAEFPYSVVTQTSRRYHRASYEAWCAEHNIAPWPPTLDNLLRYASHAARTKAYYTVRAHVLFVSLIERKRSGRDLASHPTMVALLDGLKRERPPAPPRPLRTTQIERLFSFEPNRLSRRTTQSLLLLTYCVGITLTHHLRLRCEMVSFEGENAIINGSDEDRPMIVIGPARSPARCPVRALRFLISGRSSGPLYHSSRGRIDGLSYAGTTGNIRSFGLAAGVTPLSNERVRLAGMIEQSRQIDMVRLAQFPWVSERRKHRAGGRAAHDSGSFIQTAGSIIDGERRWAEGEVERDDLRGMGGSSCNKNTTAHRVAMWRFHRILDVLPDLRARHQVPGSR